LSDSFEVLGVEPAFELDLAALEARHRELSRALHPDRYTGRPASERRMALDRAISVNEALRQLKDPVKRALELLKRAGVEVPEGTEPPADPEFLMEMMEQREELSEARRAANVEQVEGLSAKVRARQLTTLAALGEKFASLSPAELQAQGGSLVALVGELRYYRRFFDEAEAILDELL
jgi:molecular chaperone HscB